MKIIINGESPTLNEVIKASKSHYMAYANQKKDYTALTMMQVEDMEKVTNPVDIKFTWYRKDRRSDPDNISGGGAKMVLDGLVKAGKLNNDGWREVNSLSHYFEVDRDNPRVEVEIREIKKESV